MTELGSPESNTLKISFDFVILGPSILCSISLGFALQIFKGAAEANNFKDFSPKCTFHPSSSLQKPEHGHQLFLGERLLATGHLAHIHASDLL